MTSEVNMKQLSQMSGYSISTVSKALNDKNDISQETINKIKDLLKRISNK